MRMVSVRAHAVAEQIRRRVPGIGVVRLHKLLYYVQGHHLASFGRPAFEDTISAWDLGPVVGTLWFEENSAGGPVPTKDSLDEAVLNTIGYVVSRYGNLSSKDLIHLTHSEAPWRIADANRQPGGRVSMTEQSMRDYFSEPDEDDPGFEAFDRNEWSALLAGAEVRLSHPARSDSPESLRARLARA